MFLFALEYLWIKYFWNLIFWKLNFKFCEIKNIKTILNAMLGWIFYSMFQVLLYTIRPSWILSECSYLLITFSKYLLFDLLIWIYSSFHLSIYLLSNHIVSRACYESNQFCYHLFLSVIDCVSKNAINRNPNE